MVTIAHAAPPRTMIGGASPNVSERPSPDPLPMDSSGDGSRGSRITTEGSRDPSDAVRAVPVEARAPSYLEAGHRNSGLAALTIGAIGIVFGDIGTSPLYTFQEFIGGPHGVAVTQSNVLGVLSLIFWSLMLVVTMKYMLFLMRADNRGEGGILALLALVPAKPRAAGRIVIPTVAVLVIVGAALLFGDGIITPAISVLSAIEGLEVATSRFHPFVVPLTVAILLALFAIQSRGTGGIGRVFGPVMVVWFLAIGSLGAYHVTRNPVVLAAMLPSHAVSFFVHNGGRGFVLLGSVVLAVTGGEALYADMGHFGPIPIRRAWLGLILPALVLCYFGQGALILRAPSYADAPFFGMVPRGFATYALVAIAAPATVIASQALISGVFSLANQAIRLGFFPRVEVRHTSREAEGQIYLPFFNWLLALACVALVVAFRSSSKLAAAFGLAVSGTMAITSVVYYVVVREAWGWSRPKALAVLLLFLAFDIPFLTANLLKFFDGGYLPLLVGAAFFVAMVIWKRGRLALADFYTSHTPTLGEFRERLRTRVELRVPGTGVFLTSTLERVPLPLQLHVEKLHVLERVVVLLNVTTEHVPAVDPSTRVAVAGVLPDVYLVEARYGFMETPNVPDVLAHAVKWAELPIDLDAVTYYLGRETFTGGAGGQMGRVTESIFAFLSRNQRNATLYFGIPIEQVVELGAQIDL